MKTTETNQSARNLRWKLNWFRQSELEGAIILGRLVGRVGDEHLIQRLTRHAAEEARHSEIWTQTIVELGLPFIRIRRSYQSFYVEHGGVPASVVDVLAFTQVFEQRVHRRFHEEMRQPKLPEAARRAFRVMIEDEKDHLQWVAEWLQDQPGANDRLAHYRKVDRRVFDALSPYEDRLWEIPGLGEEFPTTSEPKAVA